MLDCAKGIVPLTSPLMIKDICAVSHYTRVQAHVFREYTVAD